jgi:hypothetical protein
MEKKGKIVRTVFKNKWSAGTGSPVFYHDIELDNGDKGSIGAKEEMPAKLNPGQELTYTIETDNRGGFKIKAVNPAGAGGFNAAGKRGPDPKVQIVGFAMSYTKDLIVGGKVDIKNLPEIFEKIHKLMSDKL